MRSRDSHEWIASGVTETRGRSECVTNGSGEEGRIEKSVSGGKEGLRYHKDGVIDDTEAEE